MGNRNLEFQPLKLSKTFKLSSTSMNTFNLRALMIIGLLLVNFTSAYLSPDDIRKLEGRVAKLEGKPALNYYLSPDDVKALEARIAKLEGKPAFGYWPSPDEITQMDNRVRALEAAARRPIDMKTMVERSLDALTARVAKLEGKVFGRRMRKAMILLQDD